MQKQGILTLNTEDKIVDFKKRHKTLDFKGKIIYNKVEQFI